MAQVQPIAGPDPNKTLGLPQQQFDPAQLAQIMQLIQQQQTQQPVMPQQVQQDQPTIPMLGMTNTPPPIPWGADAAAIGGGGFSGGFGGY